LIEDSSARGERQFVILGGSEERSTGEVRSGRQGHKSWSEKTRQSRVGVTNLRPGIGTRATLLTG
jgi:hypothetical protein